MIDRLKKYRNDLIYILLASVLFLVILYFFWIRPSQELNNAAFSLTTKEFLELKNALRVGLAQALGGAVLLTGLFFSWRSIRATERNLEIAQQGMKATQESTSR